MSLTHHIKPMKLFTLIASAAVIGASFLVPHPVEARNDLMKGGCDTDGTCVYQKVISKNCLYVVFKGDMPIKIIAKVGDCQQWRSKITSINADSIPEEWDDAIPGSIAEAALRNVCR